MLGNLSISSNSTLNCIKNIIIKVRYLCRLNIYLIAKIINVDKHFVSAVSEALSVFTSGLPVWHLFLFRNSEFLPEITNSNIFL